LVDDEQNKQENDRTVHQPQDWRKVDQKPQRTKLHHAKGLAFQGEAEYLSTQLGSEHQDRRREIIHEIQACAIQ